MPNEYVCSPLGIACASNEGVNTTTLTTFTSTLTVGQLVDPNSDPGAAAVQTNWVSVAALHGNWVVFGTQDCVTAAKFVATLKSALGY